MYSPSALSLAALLAVALAARAATPVAQGADAAEGLETKCEKKEDAIRVTAEGSKTVEAESAGNLKATWVNHGKARDWFSAEQGQGREFLFHAVRIKTVWTPYGV